MHALPTMNIFRRILVPIDFELASKQALLLATEMARRFDATLLLLHVDDPSGSVYSGVGDNVPLVYVPPTDPAAQRSLEALVENTATLYPRVEGAFMRGVPWRCILEAIETQQVELVVMGTHGRRGFSRLVTGSVAEKIVRLCPVPVLTTFSAEAAQATP